MLNKDQKFKIILGTLVPAFVILLVIGFCFVMIGYHVGSQESDVTTNTSLVIPGWIFIGIGLVGYFTLFTIVLIKRQLLKQKQKSIVEPTK